MSIETTVQEIEIIQRRTNDLAIEIMRHVHGGAIGLGFADRQARFIAVTTILLRAAQLYSLSIHGGRGLYEVFKAQCAIMAGSDANAVIRDSKFELGAEAFGETPSLILPPGTQR